MNESPVSNKNVPTDPPVRQSRREGPDNSIRTRGSVAQAILNDRTGFFIAIVALFVSGIAVGYQMRNAETRRLEDQATDARIAAAVERAKGDMQTQIAEAKAVANLYRTEALLTKTNVDALYTKLNTKGINVGTPDGH